MREPSCTTLVSVFDKIPGAINILGHTMYANPWHFHHAGQFVLVVWLMLMEDDGKIESIIDLFNRRV